MLYSLLPVTGLTQTPEEPLAEQSVEQTDSKKDDVAVQDAKTESLKVTIEGIEDPLYNNVSAFLKINRLTRDDTTLPDETRINWLHSQAREDIERALQPFGYYKPTIDSDLKRTEDGWEATYRIDPGPPLPIAAVDIKIIGEGESDPAFQDVLNNLPFAPGKTLEHEPYEKLKQTLQALATERGYFDAKLVQNQIRVDLQDYQANIILRYDTGARYNYGAIVFDQDVLAPEFLQRYVKFNPGDPYYAPDLLALQSDLINSEYFDEVVVSTDRDNAVDHSLPVDIKLDPRKAHQYTFGLGYGTDTGVRGRLGIEKRLANRWGHHYQAQFLASQIKFSLAGEYVIPGEDPRTDSFNLRSNVTQESTDIKDSTTAVLGVSQQRQDGKWLKIRSLDYQWETFNFDGEEDETTGLLIGGLNWSRVDADPDRLNVTSGSRFNFEFKGASEFLLSDLTFIQAVVRSKWIQSLGSKGRLLLRGDAGATYIADSDFDKFPSSLRFFAGGDRSVRGYTLDSIGPRDDDDKVIGGKYLLVGSLEYEYPILDKWSVAAFVDSGDAFNDTPEFKTGVGIGVRWQSPVGPIRVDIASGLNDPGDTIRLHFNIGPDL